ncbi:MAG: ABC transporter permease [Acidobacteria bacterium]|nr:ABC transporter permease [Acidobacteriota bacterium]
MGASLGRHHFGSEGRLAVRLLDILKLRLRALLFRSRVESELDEEIRYHLERDMEEHVARGLDPREARLAALRGLRDVEQRREECRDARGWSFTENAAKDVRFALRQLRRDKEFAATAVLMLALGIASSTAIFAFVDAALLQPLPYRDPLRLVGVYERLEPQCRWCNLSWPDYLDWKRLNNTLEDLELYQRSGWRMSAAGGAVAVRGARVSAGFFSLLGVQPSFGRLFQSGEDQPKAPRTALLSYSAWRTHFGGRADILGQTVILDQLPYVVIGVLPASFHFAPVGAAELWVPFQAQSECDLRRGCHSSYGLGRLKPGVSVEAALANFAAIAAQLERQYPDTNRDQGANVRLLSEAIVGQIRPILLVLLAGATLLLLIAFTDVTGLLLVRAEWRQREMAVRAALGASTGRLMAQLGTEAAVLVSAATLLGIAGAHLLMRTLPALLPEDLLSKLPFLAQLHWSPRLALFVAAIAISAALLFAVAPNLLRWRPQIVASLAEGSRGSAGTAWRRLGAKLVVTEIATAAVLLIGAGLLSQSLHNLLRVHLGLRPDNLVTLEVAAPATTYSTGAKALTLTRDLLDRATSLPGVQSAGLAANGSPLTHNGNTTWIRVLGRPWHGEHIDVPERDVTPGYFSTLGAKLLQGRFFSDTDDSSHPKVAIINLAFARRHFPGQNPIGQLIGQPSADPAPVQVVGVVDDIRQGPLDEEIPPFLYKPLLQSPDTYISLVARTDQDPGALLPALSTQIRSLDPEIITMRGATMQRQIGASESAFLRRLTAYLAAGFALLALLLAVVGLYGVIAYSVSQRTREIGVRMALGATATGVYAMIFRQAAWLAALGIAAGLAAGAGAARFLRSLLFGVTPWDPVTLGAIAVLLAAAAAMACFIPARRAATVNPVEALRSE